MPSARAQHTCIGGAWIWSPRLELSVFGGSALLALLLVAFNHVLDWSTDPFPEWAWLFLVLGVDVAHVYATLFRTYLDVTRGGEDIVCSLTVGTECLDDSDCTQPNICNEGTCEAALSMPLTPSPLVATHIDHPVSATPTVIPFDQPDVNLTVQNVNVLYFRHASG